MYATEELLEAALRPRIVPIPDPGHHPDLADVVKDESFASTVRPEDDPASEVVQTLVHRLHTRQFFGWVQDQPTVSDWAIDTVVKAKELDVFTR